jgi:hypothetical protein
MALERISGGATHDVTVTIQAGSVTKPSIHATVGSPTSTSGPSNAICP